MSYQKLNARSIRLFAATPDELAKKRPNLNAPYFRVSRSMLDALLADAGDGDPIMSLAIWKRKGRDGKPDYFTAELTFPEGAEKQSELRTKDDEWMKAHPKTIDDTKRRRDYAMNLDAAKKIGVEEAPTASDDDALPF